MKSILSALIVSASLIPMSVSNAANLKWEGEVTIDRLDCKVANVDEVVVSGSVTLIHPEDLNPQGPIKEIGMDCPKLTFEEGSSLTTISSLDFRISDITSGAVKITNTRGVAGADAEPTPEIWARKKMPKGNDGAHGGGGSKGRGCAGINDHSSTAGGGGAAGIRGVGGDTITASKGAPGKPGGTGGDVVLLSRNFAAGTTIEINTEGGNGGAGGLGGRGADGGNGGNGGNGGKGGDASRCHGSSGGGHGGAGGNGGNGGNGGEGGKGGDGGNGGNVTAALQEGAGFSPTPIIKNKGGIGGDPGLGGERGEGGTGGAGGNGGRGGAGKKGPLDIDTKPPGQGGNAGVRGKDGLPGERGPIGIRGKDGQQGRIGKGFTGTLPKDAFDRLINSGS